MRGRARFQLRLEPLGPRAAGEAIVEPLRTFTDVTGEPYWTIIAEAKVEKIDDFFAMEHTLMTNETLQKTMADYHELVASGRREIYRIES